jgi:ectoine hydroxylase-related dioxygenase (phytanoyl-CoA dioxygenase family)
MTTYPLGFLVANWVAFEDVRENSGPLEYYPGSHKLPYLLSAEVGLAPNDYKRNGAASYSQHYEPAIFSACEKAGLEKKTFLAKKGDVLFWHANLAHGGAARIDRTLSRKALVCHFFAERTVTYHDLSGNASRLHKNGMYAPMAV